MKLKLASFCTLLVFLFTGISFAANTAKSQNLTLATAVHVGNSVLQPGDYKVSWDGNGATANVSFVKGKTTVATAPAKIQNVTGKQDTSVQMSTASGSATLQKINFSHVSLDFSQSSGGTSTPSGR